MNPIQKLQRRRTKEVVESKETFELESMLDSKETPKSLIPLIERELMLRYDEAGEGQAL